MRAKALAAVLSCLTLPALAADVATNAAVEAALTAVKDLGTINGQALACADMPVATRAKTLMLAHAPKTSIYGDAYQEATQAAFMAQGKSTDCPAGADLGGRLDRLAKRLAEVLPQPGAR